MPIDPNIPLQSAPRPLPEQLQYPLDVQQQAAQVRNLQEQQGVLQQEQQRLQVENEQRRLEVDQQQRLNRAWQDAMGGPAASAPSSGTNGTVGARAALAGPSAATPPAPQPPEPSASSDPWPRFFSAMERAGVHPQTILKLKTDHQKLLQDYANLGKDRQAIEQGKVAAFGAQAKSLLGLPDDTARAQYWTSTARPALIRAGEPEAELPQALPTGDEGTQFLWLHLQAANALKGVQDSVDSQTKVAAQALGSATTEDDWNRKMQGLRSTVQPVILSQFGAWDDNAPARARSMGLSPAEQLKAPSEQADTEQKIRANDAAILANAARRGRQAYIDTRNRMTFDRASFFPEAPTADKYDPAKFAQEVNSRGLTSEQATMAEDRDATRAATEAARASTEAYREKRLALDRDKAATRTTASGRPMTAAQFTAAEHRLDADEFGVPSRPGGVDGRRRQIGEILKAGKETIKDSEVTLTPTRRTALQQDYNTSTAHQQAIQFDRADLYGIQRPDADTVNQSKEGETVIATDGSAWKKQGGILWFQGKGNAAPAQAPSPATGINPSAPPAAAAPKQTQGPAPAAPKLPQEIVSQLKADAVTKLSDGTAWALVNGQPTQMKKVNGKWTAQ